jgi:hypothetical protein
MKSDMLFLFCVLGLVAARPLAWFADESFENPTHGFSKKHLADAVENDWEWPSSPAHMHMSSGPTSFLQTSTGGHPLECDCERVKCNCVKRCECGLPAAAQNHQASSFLEIAYASGKTSLPLWVDVETNECFLQTGESVGQDSHHMLDCECDKVKCNCVKHCECSLPASAAGAAPTAGNDLLQLDQGTGPKMIPKKPVSEENEKAPDTTTATPTEETKTAAPVVEVAPSKESPKASRGRRAAKSVPRRAELAKQAKVQAKGAYKSGSYAYSHSQKSDSASYSGSEYSEN